MTMALSAGVASPSRQRSRRKGRGIAVVAAAGLALPLSLMGMSAASAASTDIDSDGPLTKISTSEDLNCAVNHADDSHGEWYGDTACGTFVAVDGKTYGPNYVPAGPSSSREDYVSFTPVSQSGVSGDGSSSSPYQVTTVVELGDTGITLEQRDAYVVGEESYRTDVTLSSADEAYSTIIYRAGDCYLQDDDYGVGRVDSGGAPICQASPTAEDPSRIMGMYPLSPGSNYIEDSFGSVWQAVTSQEPLPNTVYEADTRHDNALGLSWNRDIAPGSPGTVAHMTLFSPMGATALVFSKTADDDTVDYPEEDSTGYTVTVTNEGAITQTLNSITDTLPAEFSYVPGSTTGVTTDDPAISGQDLTWDGPFEVPDEVDGEPGTITLNFEVTVDGTPGTFTNSVSGEGDGISVIPANDVAPVTVNSDGDADADVDGDADGDADADADADGDADADADGDADADADGDADADADADGEADADADGEADADAGADADADGEADADAGADADVDAGADADADAGADADADAGADADAAADADGHDDAGADADADDDATDKLPEAGVNINQVAIGAVALLLLGAVAVAVTRMRSTSDRS